MPSGRFGRAAGVETVRRRGHPFWAVLCLMVAAPVFAPSAESVAPDDPPAFLLGAFVDDYGVRYTITDSTWAHGADALYHVVRWSGAGAYLVARNDAGNPGEGGQWTRIDWVELDSDDFTWAYCYTVYDAPSVEAAERAPAADRATPRTGCNGFPFTRMRRVTGR